MKKLRLGHVVPVAALALSLTTAAAPAAITVFYDDFEDGNRDGWYMTNQDGTGYYNATVESAAPLLNGPTNNELRATLNNATENQDIYSVSTTFTDINLNSVGDFIELSFQTSSGGHIAPRTGFRFGLYNDGGTPVTADGNHGNNTSILTSTELIGNDVGVFAGISVEDTKPAWTAELRDTDVPRSFRWPLWRGSSSQFALETVDDSLLINDDVDYTLTLRITRNGDGDLEVVLFNNEYPGDPTAILAGTVVDPNTYLFNTIYFGVYHQNNEPLGVQDLRYDNVAVTTNAIPTPAAGLAGMVGLGLIGLRRRRR